MEIISAISDLTESTIGDLEEEYTISERDKQRNKTNESLFIYFVKVELIRFDIFLSYQVQYQYL